MSYNDGYGQNGYGRSNPYNQGGQGQRNPPPQRSPFGDGSRVATPPGGNQYGSSQGGYGMQNNRRNNDVEMSNMPGRQPGSYGQPAPYGQQQSYGGQQQQPYGQRPPNNQRPSNGPPPQSYGQSRPSNGPPPQSFSQPRPANGPPPQGYGQRPPYQQSQQPSQPYSQPYGQPQGANQPQEAYGQQTTMNGSAGGQGQPDGPNPSDPNAILNECSRVDEGTTQLTNLLDRLQAAQRRALNDVSAGPLSPSVREVDAVNAEIMSTYKSLINRMKWIKSRPESGSPRNQQQIGRVDRALKSTYEQYRKVENDHERRMREQIERQYRVVKPDASEEEVRAAVEDTNQQIFSQALMRSDRQGESRQVLSAVQNRHEAIKKIETQMIELAEMFQQLNETVIQQDEQIVQVEQQTEVTHADLENANTQLDSAIVSAEGARRKKWICFWICVTLIIIVIAIVVIVLAVNHDL